MLTAQVRPGSQATVLGRAVGSHGGGANRGLTGQKSIWGDCSGRGLSCRVRALGHPTQGCRRHRGKGKWCHENKTSSSVGNILVATAIITFSLLLNCHHLAGISGPVLSKVLASIALPGSRQPHEVGNHPYFFSLSTRALVSGSKSIVPREESGQTCGPESLLRAQGSRPLTAPGAEHQWHLFTRPPRPLAPTQTRGLPVPQGSRQRSPQQVVAPATPESLWKPRATMQFSYFHLKTGGSDWAQTRPSPANTQAWSSTQGDRPACQHPLRAATPSPAAVSHQDAASSLLPTTPTNRVPPLRLLTLCMQACAPLKRAQSCRTRAPGRHPSQPSAPPPMNTGASCFI